MSVATVKESRRHGAHLCARADHKPGAGNAVGHMEVAAGGTAFIIHRYKRSAVGFLDRSKQQIEGHLRAAVANRWWW